MNRLALIGVSHRRGGAAALEAFGDSVTPEVLAELGLREFVPITTCNRMDVVLTLPDNLTLDEARRRLTPAGTKPYAFEGDGAVEQLTRVAASLDSLNPGEDQIMAQVREAFKVAKAEGWTGKKTSFAFQTALRIAKRVRREVELAPMNTSLFSLARPVLEAELPPGATVAVLGAGQMGTLAAKTVAQMRDTNLLVVNRNEARAKQLAKHLGAEGMSLEAFLTAAPEVQALVCATSAKGLVDKAFVVKLSALKIVVDLGIPRNVKVGAACGVKLLDVDSLQAAGAARRSVLQEKLARAEQVVQAELDAALTEWTERQLGSSIKKLREMYLETVLETLGSDADPSANPGADNAPAARVAPELAAKLAHKFAHVPVKGLRAVAREYGLDAAKVFLVEAGLE